MTTRSLAYFSNEEGTSRCYIPTINNGYRTTIKFPWYSTERTDGTLGIWDNGIEYDYRVFKMVLELDEERAEALTEFYKDWGRKDSIKFYVPNDWGTYPFGPDLTIGQTFTVKINNFVNSGMTNSPYLYHRFNIELVLESTPSYDSITYNDCVEPGTLSINSVTNIRFPDDLFKPDVQYENYTELTQGGALYIIDRGHDSDRKETEFEVYASRQVAGKLLKEIVQNIRTSPFVLNVPKNSYPFGIEEGDSAGFLCKLNQREIVVQHMRYNDFRFSINMRMVA